MNELEKQCYVLMIDWFVQEGIRTGRYRERRRQSYWPVFSDVFSTFIELGVYYGELPEKKSHLYRPKPFEADLFEALAALDYVTPYKTGFFWTDKVRANMEAISNYAFDEPGY